MPESPVDAARVNGDAETARNPICQLSAGDARLGGTGLGDETHQFGRELVTGSRTPLERQQTGEPGALKRGLSLVERWPGESENPRGLTDGRLFDLDQPKHLVLDLQQIVGIEELVRPEGLVDDILRPRVERALLAQEVSFGLPRIGHKCM